MLSESELAEMLDIRRRIDGLQMRYNELAAKMAAPPGAAGQFAARPPAPAPIPMAPQPVYQQPIQYAQPVAQYAQPYPQQAPQGYVQQPAQPMMAQPVMVQPMAPRAPQPPAPAYQQPMPASALSQDDLETKRLPPRPAAAPAAPKDRASMTLKDHVVDVLEKAGKALPFEEVYKRLEEGGAPLPKEKPKLVVRQILYNKALFEVARGAFTLVPGAAAPAATPPPQKNPVFANTKPGDLFKHRLDAMLGKDKQ